MDESLLLRGDANLSSSIFGDAGSATITAGRVPLVGGTVSSAVGRAARITSAADLGSGGDAGEERVIADESELRDRTPIDSATFASGAGGTVIVGTGVSEDLSTSITS